MLLAPAQTVEPLVDPTTLLLLRGLVGLLGVGDHFLLTPQAADRLAAAGIDSTVRGRERPSDHVPVWVELDI